MATIRRNKPALVKSVFLGVLALTLALLGTGRPASATTGVYDAAVDVDPGTAGIQDCIAVNAGDPVSVDLVLIGVDAADSNNFASGGNVGVNYPTGTFTSPAIDFTPGVIDDIPGFTALPFASTDANVLGLTHVSRGFFNFSGGDTSAVAGDFIAARVNLTAGSSTGLKTIDITKTSPLDGSWDSFIGVSPTIQPASIQPGDIDIGGACVPNNPPVADDKAVTTPEDTPKDITLTATDPDGNCPLTFSIVGGPSDGSLGSITGATCLAGSASATVQYAPDADFNGADSFTYKASDGIADSNTATVDVTITPVNDPPDAVDDVASAVVLTPTVIDVLANDSDPDVGNTLTITAVGDPPNGTASTDGSTVTYTSDPSFLGPDSFTYTISDGVSTDTATVNVTVTSNPPVAPALAVNTDEDTSVGITLTASDPDGDCPLTFSIVSGPTNGSLSSISSATCLAGSASATVQYTPDADFNGGDSFTYTAADPSGAVSVGATVSVTVNPVNDPPVADNQNVSTPQDTPTAVTLSATDIDSCGLIFPPIVTPPANGSLSDIGTGIGSCACGPSGCFGSLSATVTYTPNANFIGSDSFTYKANDGALDSNIATVFITVTPAPAGPANDNFSDAILITSLPFTDSRSTVGATRESLEPQPCAAIGSTVWYSFTPAVDTQITAHTIGSNFDTAIAAYSGGSLATLSTVACDDDGGPWLLSTISFSATAGTTYHFQVGGFAGLAGPLVFNVTGTVVPPTPTGTFLSFVSEPGDYIGQGQSRTMTPDNANINTTVTEDHRYIRVNVFPFAGGFWNLDMAAPAGQQLVPGVYENATRWPFQAPSVPGLAFSGDGRGCNTLTGRFEVLEAVYGPLDFIERFHATFEQHCEGAPPALFGEVQIVNPPPPMPSPTLVSIAVKPGGDPNSTNLGSQGVIPVAILTTASFDAATVNSATVVFEGAPALRSALEDVDNDGDTDLIMHFWTQDTSIPPTAVEACLTGETTGGQQIEGCDALRIVPPHTDGDGDSFSDAVEATLRTDQFSACATKPTHDAWPADLNNDRQVNILDVFELFPAAYKSLGDGEFSIRFDLSTDGIVNDLDVFELLPMWVSGCLPDTDRDGFIDEDEALSIGTNPLLACGENAWPPDMNSDRSVNILDVFEMFPVWLGVSSRHDLNADGSVNIVDVFRMFPFWMDSCT